MSTLARVSVTAALMVLAAGCGNAGVRARPSASPASGQVLALPPCSTGHGSDGSVSTLAIRQHWAAFTGVYLTRPPGMLAGSALRYDVTGTARDGRLTSTWTLGNVALQVTGRYTASGIVLDDPRGSFSTTVFRASSRCPA